MKTLVYLKAQCLTAGGVPRDGVNYRKYMVHGKIKVEEGVFYFISEEPIISLSQLKDCALFPAEDLLTHNEMKVLIAMNKRKEMLTTEGKENAILRVFKKAYESEAKIDL